MSLPKSDETYGKFYEIVRKAVTDKTIINRFSEYSKSGNRLMMIKTLLEIQQVADWRVTEKFDPKNNYNAEKLYDIWRKTETEENLTKVLCTAEVTHKFFLSALVDRAFLSYKNSLFERCLKDCEFFFQLPIDSYSHIKDYFAECKNKIVSLKRECTKRLRNKCNIRRNGANPVTKKINIPSLDGKPHKTLQSCANVICLRQDEKRGRHLIATKEIKPGTVLIVDRPYAFSTEKDALGRNCIHCHISLKLENNIKIPCTNCQNVFFCSITCRDDAIKKFHKYECRIFNHFFENSSQHFHKQISNLLLAYRVTVAAALKKIEDQNHNNETCSPIFQIDTNFLNDNLLDNTDTMTRMFEKLGSSEIYNPLDYKTVLRLQTHSKNADVDVNLKRSIEAIFLAKCMLLSLNTDQNDSVVIPIAVGMLRHLQAINCNAYEIVENVRDEKSHVWEPHNVGGAIYTTVSLVNHGCYPNVVRHIYPCSTVVVRAIRLIKEGEELLDNYGPHFLSENQIDRRQFLRNKYHFHCDCEACSANWKMPLVNLIEAKCRFCSEIEKINLDFDKIDAQEIKHCKRCEGRYEIEKVVRQLCKSVERRRKAVAKMYEGCYVDALPILLEHETFVERYLAIPSLEAIRTQQCIVQCYNSLGCVSR